MEDGGVVHQYVDAPELADGGSHSVLPVVLAGDVAPDEDGGIAQFVGNHLAAVVEDVEDDDPHPLCDEGPGYLLPAAARASGDDTHLAIQPAHGDLPSSAWRFPR